MINSPPIIDTATHTCQPSRKRFLSDAPFSNFSASWSTKFITHALTTTTAHVCLSGSGGKISLLRYHGVQQREKKVLRVFEKGTLAAAGSGSNTGSLVLFSTIW